MFYTILMYKVPKKYYWYIIIYDMIQILVHTLWIYHENPNTGSMMSYFQPETHTSIKIKMQICKLCKNQMQVTRLSAFLYNTNIL